MITQTKTLKDLLKKHGIDGGCGLPLSVRTEKNKHGEWGRAVAYTRILTKTEIEALKEENTYINIFQSTWIDEEDGKEYGATIIRYPA